MQANQLNHGASHIFAGEKIVERGRGLPAKLGTAGVVETCQILFL